MTPKDYHAHNLDALLDNLYTTLHDGYLAAMFDPETEEERFLASLFSGLEERMSGGNVRIADKVRHD